MEQLINLNMDFAAVLLLLIAITTGTQSFVSSIAKIVTLFTPAVTQFANQVGIKLILQLIKSILKGSLQITFLF